MTQLAPMASAIGAAFFFGTAHAPSGVVQQVGLTARSFAGKSPFASGDLALIALESPRLFLIKKMVTIHGSGLILGTGALSRPAYLARFKLPAESKE